MSLLANGGRILRALCLGVSSCLAPLGVGYASPESSASWPFPATLSEERALYYEEQRRRMDRGIHELLRSQRGRKTPEEVAAGMQQLFQKMKEAEAIFTQSEYRCGAPQGQMEPGKCR